MVQADGFMVIVTFQTHFKSTEITEFSPDAKWRPFSTDCSICEDGYTKGVAFTCMRCTSNRKAISTAVIAALGVLGIAAGVGVIFYLISGEMVGSGRGFIDNIARHLPMQSVKIIIVAWQILTQVRRGKIPRGN